MKEILFRLDIIDFIAKKNGCKLKDITKEFNFQTNTVKRLRHFLATSPLVQKSADQSFYTLQHNGDTWLLKDIFIYHTLLKTTGTYLVSRDRAETYMIHIMKDRISSMVPLGYEDKVYEKAIERRIKDKLNGVQCHKNEQLDIIHWAYHMYHDMFE